MSEKVFSKDMIVLYDGKIWFGHLVTHKHRLKKHESHNYDMDWSYEIQGHYLDKKNIMSIWDSWLLLSISLFMFWHVFYLIIFADYYNILTFLSVFMS